MAIPKLKMTYKCYSYQDMTCHLISDGTVHPLYQNPSKGSMEHKCLNDQAYEHQETSRGCHPRISGVSDPRAIFALTHTR